MTPLGRAHVSPIDIPCNYDSVLYRF